MDGETMRRRWEAAVADALERARLSALASLNERLDREAAEARARYTTPQRPRLRLIRGGKQ